MKLKPHVDTRKKILYVMFTRFICDLLGFFVRKFPVKSKKKHWKFIFDQMLYNTNMSNLNDVQPEEFLALVSNLKIAIDGTGTNMTTGRIIYIRTMLRGQSLSKFD